MIRTGRVIFFYPVILLFMYSFFFLLFFRKELFFNQFNDSLFIASPEYFRSLINEPGGLVSYAANYLVQFYRSGTAGALILSSVFVIIFLLIEKIILLLNVKADWLFIVLVPSCLILAAQTDMDYHISNSLGYILALLFLFVCIRNRRRSLISFFILYPTAYLVTGFFSFLFAGMFIFYTVAYAKGLRRYVTAGTILLFALLVPVLSKLLLFLQPWKIILLSPLQFSSTGRPSILLLLAFVYSMIIPLTCTFKIFHEMQARRLTMKAVLSVICVIFLTVLILFEDSEKQRTSRMERYVYAEEWENIISTYRYSEPDLLNEHYYCLALANRGILCDSLFRAPHLHGINSLMLPREKKNLPKQVYFFYHLGLIREAHHLAYESMVNFGYTPEILKFLLKTNIIARKYAVAEKYINILGRTCLKSTMNKYAGYIRDTALILSDPEINRKREMLPDKDFFIRYNDYQNLELFLLLKPDNPIALQYKLAILMLHKDLEPLVYEVKNLKNAGFRNIPLHLEEALLIDKLKRPEVYVNITSFIRAETERKFEQYSDEMKKYNLTGVLAGDFIKQWGNTYWYYYDFHNISE